MKKLLLTLMLAVVSSSEMAEWVEFFKDADETFTVYVDPATIRKSGSKVKMWALYDFSTVREVEGKKLMSSKVQSVWNCEEDEQGMLYVVGYTESMGEG